MITFDYAQMNKKGLKDVVKWLEKQALPVAEVRGNNVPKRENGFQIKSAEIEFESGQILVVKAKANVPSFFQVKLNGKVLAIRDYKQLDNELREIAAFVKENEPKYSKNQEKAAAKAKVKVDVPKPVVTTTTEQTEAFKASLAELQGQGESLGNQITEVTAQVNQKTGQLADLQGKLDAEKATTIDLETAIEKAQQGIFESSDPTEAGVFEAVGKVNEKKFYERGHSDGKRGYPKDPAMSQVTDGGFAYLSGYADATGEDFPPNKNKGKVFESATKCEYCGAPMSNNDRRCMACGKTEQAHMLAGKRGTVLEAANRTEFEDAESAVRYLVKTGKMQQATATSLLNGLRTGAGGGAKLRELGVHTDQKKGVYFIQQEVE